MSFDQHTVTDNIHWHTLAFDQLSLSQLYGIMRLRQDVFVIEQNCPYPDMDGVDPKCLHIFATRAIDTDASNKIYNVHFDEDILACARLIPKGLMHPEFSAIGRVVVAKSARGQQLGHLMLKQSIELLSQQHPETGIKIGAQHHLRSYYCELGFEQISDVYLEDGIPHIDMLLLPQLA